jgi:hypothetical protein
MDSKREVILSDELIERCREYGRRVVEGYAAGRNSGSRAVSSRGAEANPDLHQRAAQRDG